MKKRKKPQRGAPWPKLVTNPGGSKSWRYEYHDELGRHRSITLGPWPNVSEEKACALLWEKLKQNKNPLSKSSLRAFIEQVWLPPRAARWRHNTWNTYVYAIHNHIFTHPIADMSLRDIQKLDVQNWVITLGHLAKTHALKPLSVVRSAFEEAIDQGLASANPARKVLLPACRQMQPTEPLSMDDLRKVIDLPGEMGLAIRILALCGLRKSEVLALRCDDVNLSARSLRVDEGMDALGYKSTKTERSRVVALPPGLATELSEHLRACGRTGRDPLVVCPGTGKHWRAPAFRLAFMSAIKGSGIGVTPRRLRATFATLFDGDVADVQALLGHARPDMTLLHYKKAIPQRQLNSVARLEKLAKQQPSRKKGVA